MVAESAAELAPATVAEWGVAMVVELVVELVVVLAGGLARRSIT